MNCNLTVKRMDRRKACGRRLGKGIGKILLIILNPVQTEAETFVPSMFPDCFLFKCTFMIVGHRFISLALSWGKPGQWLNALVSNTDPTAQLMLSQHLLNWSEPNEDDDPLQSEFIEYSISPLSVVLTSHVAVTCSLPWKQMIFLLMYHQKVNSSLKLGHNAYTGDLGTQLPWIRGNYCSTGS